MVEPQGTGSLRRELFAHIESLQDDVRRLDDKWQKTADDIKAIIRAEVGELKTEQIADLKERIRQQEQRMDRQGLTLSHLGSKVDHYDTARGVVAWMIKTVIAIIGAVAGIFGWENWPHH